MNTATIILRQLGGQGRLKAMLNARNFVELERGVQFRFSQRKRSLPNKIAIELNGKDLYDVTFYRQGSLDCEALEEVSDVHVEQLKGLIEDKIGMYLSL